MLNKLMKFLGLDDAVIEPVNNQSEMARLQAENRELREIIKRKNAVLQELSAENMDLGRDRQFWANTATTQRRILDIYESESGGNHETQTA